ncbi:MULTISPECIES: winged helix-turn-helix transcriptional regulator [Staphylococcus]|uniref:winged helix-turn-helix transcriptional regulator n=1 Tax=Staphylococcus TaxID=1279 RepID=UPI0008A12CE8|nr:MULTISPECIES: winged helix-turn-helix transcriptional regulator [Staphylococcus]ARB76942.1 transcriptional regulator [Staphylococcus lugdunensis]ARJ17989.1 transcriptional regulator [Staphylococcus lugdunensis]MBM7134725.1 winged helix-turn-helix transcriptional regulator [Staphylococcus lugdunensis]MCH8643029.1 winged helix-turn-helix transcriptional regulator [Staphylococcus lugdunensis]MCH8645347.1 winged helix-turn-helix transcriptional regulator [Staphylococcus lugdunensis]
MFKIGDTKDIEECEGMDQPMEILVGKWKPIILFYLLNYGTLRFSDLQKLEPRITKKMLTQELRYLEANDIVHREVYPEVPPKVEYSMTEYGKSLKPVLEVMIGWGKTHLKHMENKNS